MSRLHILTGEHSRLRRWSLYVFARYLEMPLLRLGYLMLRGRLRRLGQFPLVRAVLGLLVAAPFGYLGDTARPVPYPQVLRLVAKLDGPIAVGPCRCRTAHGACDHPRETDIVIRTGVTAWTRAFPHDYRLVEKAEAREIVTACHRQGLWHMVFVHCPVNLENEYVICNCCTCGCMPYILHRDLGPRAYPLLRGEYVAVTAPDRCTGQGDCVAACPFGARALEGDTVQWVAPCRGCGMCVASCPEQAIAMVARANT